MGVWANLKGEMRIPLWEATRMNLPPTSQNTEIFWKNKLIFCTNSHIDVLTQTRIAFLPQVSF